MFRLSGFGLRLGRFLASFHRVASSDMSVAKAPFVRAAVAVAVVGSLTAALLIARRCDPSGRSDFCGFRPGPMVCLGV